jgi:hypothetical protein
MLQFAAYLTIVIYVPSLEYVIWDNSFTAQATVNSIINNDRSVITSVNYDRKTLIVQAREHAFFTFLSRALQ